MNPPHIILKGSVVRIGTPKDTTSEFFSRDHVGMEIYVNEDTTWGELKRVQVIKDPLATGWKKIIHKFAITSDEVIYHPPNKALADGRLRKVDD